MFQYFTQEGAVDKYVLLLLSKSTTLFLSWKQIQLSCYGILHEKLGDLVYILLIVLKKMCLNGIVSVKLK